MSDFDLMPDEPRFIWSVKNLQQTVVIISDLPGGFCLRPNTEYALHELFPYHKLAESKGLRTAIQNGLIKVLDKRMLSTVVVGKESDNSKELEELKNQILSLRELVDSKPNQTLIEQHSMDSEGIKSDIKKEIEILKQELTNKPPEFKTQEINSEDLSKQISDSVNASLSALLQSFQGIQTSEKEIKLDGYQEKKPEDVMTDSIVRSHKKISETAKISEKQNIKEDVSETSIDNNADILSQLP